MPNNITRTDVIIAIQECVIGRKAERNRAIIARRLIDGITFEKLAEEFELSDRQVKNIVYKCNKVIFKYLRSIFAR